MRRLLLLAAVLLAGCGSDDAEDAGGTSEAVEIVATDFAFDPDTVTVDAAGETTFRVVNEGDEEHALEVEGQGVEEETETVGPGESAELTVDLEAGEYELYCPIGDHRDRGMEGTLVVGGGSPGGGGTTTGGETETGNDTGSETETEDSGYGP